MSLSEVCGLAAIVRFPRVSGDEPAQASPSKNTPPFSPRERG